jgi:hypothetical protein
VRRHACRVFQRSAPPTQLPASQAPFAQKRGAKANRLSSSCRFMPLSWVSEFARRDMLSLPVQCPHAEVLPSFPHAHSLISCSVTQVHSPRANRSLPAWPLSPSPPSPPLSSSPRCSAQFPAAYVSFSSPNRLHAFSSAPVQLQFSSSPRRVISSAFGGWQVDNQQDVTRLFS